MELAETFKVLLQCTTSVVEKELLPVFAAFDLEDSFAFVIKAF